ncbi:MAG: nitrite/sulfite reductase [Rhodobacteraceae bacterium]|nr:nitrite/sulfite reductase [Paracoccaceae bacterium]
MAARVAEFRGQVERRIVGALTEEEFLPLRLRNGLYLQLHAYMLRVAVPYGTLNAVRMRQLAMIAERWDKGYGHFTTRQNVQFNWPRLRDVPDILEALAEVEMHAIQTSGNCIRNVTADHFAGAAADEIEDPRPTAEVVRQWSTDHPEFTWLPRKFKVAITGSPNDRAVTKAHDIGLRMLRDENGAPGYEVIIGGGLGRTPMLGKTVREFLPKADLLAYLEAILQVYNLSGRRDNKYKARIKILVHEESLEVIRARIEAAFAENRQLLKPVDPALVAAIEAAFAPPAFEPPLDAAPVPSAGLRAFIDTNVAEHRLPHYGIVTVSLKPIGGTPGDATADQMRVLADLAEALGHDDLRVSHEQNIILPHVPRRHLPEVYARLKAAGLATANVGLISDIIACPGMDYCALATARSIPVAQEIAVAFADLDRQRDIGPLKIKISGCINACGHHHVGHIGILGLDRAGVENYQITLGGDGTETAAIGERAGPGFAYDEIAPAVERLIEAYLDLRLEPGESFLAAYRRVGIEPFKAALYSEGARSDAA